MDEGLTIVVVSGLMAASGMVGFVWAGVFFNHRGWRDGRRQGLRDAAATCRAIGKQAPDTAPVLRRVATIFDREGEK